MQTAGHNDNNVKRNYCKGGDGHTTFSIILKTNKHHHGSSQWGQSSQQAQRKVSCPERAGDGEEPASRTQRALPR